MVIFPATLPWFFVSNSCLQLIQAYSLFRGEICEIRRVNIPLVDTVNIFFVITCTYVTEFTENVVIFMQNIKVNATE